MFNPGPIAPETNPPIHPEYYQPRLSFIAEIDLGETTTITTADDNDFVLGQQVRLIIPRQYGTFELNEQTGLIISILSSTEFVLNIYSVGYNNFSIPSIIPPCVAQAIPIGDVNSGISAQIGPITPVVTIPGAFINISPN